MDMTWPTNYFVDGGTTVPVWDQPPPPPGQWPPNTILTVILSIVIAVLVITAVVSLCIYCMVKRRHAKNNQATDGQIVYVDSDGQRVVNTPVTRQIVEIFRAKKNKKQPVAVASTTPLEHAQVSVQNHVQEGGQYDVSISNISQQAIVATAAPQSPPQPVVNVPAPLPAPNPTPRPQPGTTIHTVGNDPVTPPPPPPSAPAPQPDLGPAVYNVPVAACGNHGYTIQAAAFDIPEPTPAPIFMAHHHHHSSTHNQSSTGLPSFVAAQTPVPAAPQPYSAPPLSVLQPLPNVPPPPPPGQPQQYFAPPLPVPIPQGLPQQASVPYSPPSLGYPAPQLTYNPGFTFNGTLPSVYPVATQVPDGTSTTYGGGQGYAVSLPNISVQPGGGAGVNMGYTVHQ